MTILEQLAGYARERTEKAKQKRPLSTLRQQAFSMPKGSFAFENAIKKHIKKFDEQMDKYFQDLQANGREIAVNIQVWDNSETNLETEYQGNELLWHIQEWLYQNTVKGQYNLSDATENFAYFEQVRIPIIQRNRALDAREFVRGLQKYLQESPYNVTSKIIIQGLGKAALIIGEK